MRARALRAVVERLAILRRELGVEGDAEKKLALNEYCELWARAMEMLGELGKGN